MPQVVPTASRVLQVFEVFAREGRPLSNSELARHLELADSSCSDLLFTMREAGYLLRTPKSRQFYPTARLSDVAQRIAALDPLHAFATEALEILTKESGETSLCGYLEGNHVKIFACQESPHALRYVVRPGTVYDLHSAALGKAILGAMPKTERDALIDALPLPAVTPNTIRDVSVLRSEIEKCAREKWYLAKDEGSQGVAAVGIAGEVGGRLTSLSLVGPTQRVEDNLDRYVAILLDARKEFFP
ncbi:IclR family transcriptional regulator [Cupriavidus sp. 2TAF22]|uniref:IclR family transcriptional regulator n=1 Tax=unclassified Cupriavidus TaxID=2640874 RepID=UPI003F934D5B